MKQSTRLFAISAVLGLFFGLSAAKAATLETTWLGADVLIQYPDSVINGDPFDVSFSVDVSPLPETGDSLAYMTFLDITDTVDVSGSTWEYTFISDNPPWNFTLFGALGDAVMPYTQDPSGVAIRLFDPINVTRTWLWTDYNDKVVWTLHDLVLLGDTSFDLTLHEFIDGPTSFGFDVVTGFPVPEPSSALLLIVGLSIFAVRRTTR